MNVPAEATLVTLILYAFNESRYVGEAVQSMLAQDYANLEIVLSDDGSTDGTFEIKNVPTGIEVSVMAWHEIGTPANGKEIKKAALKDGDTINFSIKK